MPPTEYERLCKEEAAQHRMTGILKKMHDTSTFSAPLQYLPSMSQNSAEMRGRDTLNPGMSKNSHKNGHNLSLFHDWIVNHKKII